MNQRKRKLIEPRIQWKFAATYLQMAGIAAMVQSLVACYFLNRFAGELTHDGLAFRTELPVLLGKSFLVTFVLMTPMMLGVGIYSTFKIAGPIWRFRQYLTSLKSGEVYQPCTLRRSDELQDFCELLNDATAPLRVNEPVEETAEQLRRTA